MKRACAGALMATAIFHAYAIDGHNGIRFNMTQRDVEAKGFVCGPPRNEGRAIAVCRHMEMTGTAFGVPTQNYEVTIGPDKRVSGIRADLVGIRTVPEYIGLLNKVQAFFPTKDEIGTSSAQGMYIRDAWRAPDNSGASVFSAGGIKGLTKDTMSVTFTSPTEMVAVDKILAERERRKVVQSKEVVEPSGGDAAPDKKNAREATIAIKTTGSDPCVGPDCSAIALKVVMTCQVDADCRSGQSCRSTKGGGTECRAKSP